MEDGDIIEEIENEDEWDEGEGEVSSTSKRTERAKQCNVRLEELSTPYKRIFLALWNEHAHHLPKDKVGHLKQLLQELYAMTPEETAKYFAELRADAKKRAKRQEFKRMLKRYLINQRNQKQKRRAYLLFKRLLKCGIKYAVENPIPPLVSLRLRYLSDVVLEQLCELRGLPCVPCRTNPDRIGAFMIAVADWMAIAIERLYYAAQRAMEHGTDWTQNKTNDTTYEDFKPKVASSAQSILPKTVGPDATLPPNQTFNRSKKVKKSKDSKSNTFSDFQPKFNSTVR